jgi:hypothetical protein
MQPKNPGQKNVEMSELVSTTQMHAEVGMRNCVTSKCKVSAVKGWRLGPGFYQSRFWKKDFQLRGRQ